MFHYGDGEELYWDQRHGEVRFVVPGERATLLCRIEAGALEKEGARGDDAASCLAAAQRCFEHITRRISDKLALGLTEPDGSVLVRARDW